MRFDASIRRLWGGSKKYKGLEKRSFEKKKKTLNIRLIVKNTELNINFTFFV